MNIGDQQLIEALKSNDPRTRDKALYEFYNNLDFRSFVKVYVNRNNGSEQDAEDIFQEAIILLDRNVRNGSFRGDSSLKTYFFAIVKWYWLTVKRKNHLQVEPLNFDGVDLKVGNAEDDLIYLEKKEFLDRIVNLVGSRCQELLGYYRLDYSMAEIALIMNFSTSQMAKKQAYRCREKLKQYLSGNKEYLQMFSNQ